MDENPYYVFLNEVGGIDRVLEIQASGVKEYEKICKHIMNYCDLVNENEEEFLPKI